MTTALFRGAWGGSGGGKCCLPSAAEVVPINPLISKYKEGQDCEELQGKL